MATPVSVRELPDIRSVTGISSLFARIVRIAVGPCIDAVKYIPEHHRVVQAGQAVPELPPAKVYLFEGACTSAMG